MNGLQNDLNILIKALLDTDDIKDQIKDINKNVEKFGNITLNVELDLKNGAIERLKDKLKKIEGTHFKVDVDLNKGSVTSVKSGVREKLKDELFKIKVDLNERSFASFAKELRGKISKETFELNVKLDESSKLTPDLTKVRDEIKKISNERFEICFEVDKECLDKLTAKIRQVVETKKFKINLDIENDVTKLLKSLEKVEKIVDQINDVKSKIDTASPDNKRGKPNDPPRRPKVVQDELESLEKRFGKNAVKGTTNIYGVNKEGNEVLRNFTVQIENAEGQLRKYNYRMEEMKNSSGEAIRDLAGNIRRVPKLDSIIDVDASEKASKKLKQDLFELERKIKALGDAGKDANGNLFADKLKNVNNADQLKTLQNEVKLKQDSQKESTKLSDVERKRLEQMTSLDVAKSKGRVDQGQYNKMLGNIVDGNVDDLKNIETELKNINKLKSEEERISRETAKTEKAESREALNQAEKEHQLLKERLKLERQLKEMRKTTSLKNLDDGKYNDLLSRVSNPKSIKDLEKVKQELSEISSDKKLANYFVDVGIKQDSMINKLKQIKSIANSKEFEQRYGKDVARNLEIKINSAGTKEELREIEKEVNKVVRQAREISEEVQKGEDKFKRLTLGQQRQLQRFIDTDNTAGIKALIKSAYDGNVEITKLRRTLDSAGRSVYEYTATMADGRRMVRQFSGSLDTFNRRLHQTSEELRNNANRNLSVLEQFRIALARVPVWMGAMTVFYGAQRAIESMLHTIIEVDSQMVELKRVMNEDTDFNHMLGESIRLSNELGRSLQDVNQAMIGFARQGKSEKEIIELTEASVVASNVSELSAEEAMSDITSAIEIFGDEVENALSVVDRLNEVDNNFAITTKDLANAMHKAGSTAKTFGVDIDTLIGHITSIGVVTRESGTVIGNSLKTIYSRITTMSEAETILNSVNVSIRNMDGTTRDVSEIIEDLAGKWDNLSNTQQQNIGVTVAGRFQLSRFLAMMNGFDIAVDATNASLYSQGSAMRENEEYQKSLQARINKLKTAWQELSLTVGESILTDTFVGVVSSLTAMSKAFVSITSWIGFLPQVFGVLSIAVIALNDNLRRTSVLFGKRLIMDFKRFQRQAQATNTTRFTGSLAMLQAGLNGVRASARGARIALIGFTRFVAGIALPVLGIMAVSMALEKLISTISKARKEQKELEKEARQLSKTYESHEEEINELVKTYEDLSKKVEQGLITEDSEKYLKVQQDLYDLLPSVAERIDENGQAHLRSAEAIKEELGYLKELSDLQATEFISGFSDAVKDVEKEISNMEKRMKFLGSHGQGLQEKLIFAMAGRKDDLSPTEQIKMMIMQEQENVIQEKRIKLFQKLGHMYAQVNDLKEGLSETDEDYIRTIVEEAETMEEAQGKILEYIKMLKQFEIYLGDFGKGVDIGGFLAKLFTQGKTEKEIKKILFLLGQLDDASERSVEELENLIALLKESDVPDNIIQSILDNINGLNDEIEENLLSWENLRAKVEETSESLELLAKAENELRENHSLSTETLNELIEKYPEFTKVLGKGKEAMLEFIGASVESSKAVIRGQMAELDAIIEATEGKIKAYQKDVLAKREAFRAQKALEGYTKTEIDRMLGLTDVYSLAPLLKELDEAREKYGYLKEALHSITHEYDKNSGATKRQEEAMKESIYITDEFKLAISELNTKLRELEAIKNKYPQHSKEYRDAINKEIKLLKEKLGLINAERTSLEKQIASGNILPTGMVSGGGTSGVGYRTVSATSDVRTISNITASQLDAMLQGRLEGYGSALISVGTKYGIDPLFLAGIAMHETGRGTSPALINKNNAFGEMSRSGGLRTFSSILESIESAGSFLKRLYIDQGLITPAQIQPKYAPEGASNDPTGLNSNWTSGVTSFWNNFTSSIAGTITSAVSSSTSDVAKYYLDNYQISSPFGDGRGHRGIDFNQAGTADLGDPILSFVNGVVESINNNPNLAQGYSINIRGEDGALYKYFHMMEQTALRIGQRVNAGDTIGKIGDTGDSHGSHLHFERWLNGIASDPLPWIKQMAGQSTGGVGALAGVSSTSSSSGGSSSYTVKSGDTLSEIGQMFGIDWRKIQQANGNIDPTKLQIGQVLVIPTSGGTSGGTSSHDHGSTTGGVSDAERQQAIDQAKEEAHSLKQEAFEIAEQIQNLYFAYTQSRIASFERLKENRNDDIARAEYYAKLQKQTSAEFRRYTNHKLTSMERQKTFHIQEMAFIAEEIKSNKNISESHREELKALYNQKKIELYSMAESIREVENMIANSKIDELIEKINDKTQKIRDSISKIDKELSITSSEEDIHTDIDLNEDKLKYLIKERKQVVENIERLLKLRVELANNPEAYEKITQEIKKWKDQLDQLEINIDGIKDSLEDLYNEVADELIDAMKEMYKKKREIDLDAIDKERESLEELHEDKMDMLNDELEKYREIINEKLKEIDRQEASDSYEKELLKKQEERQEILNRINILSLDDSAEARKQLADLREQLANKEEEIVEFQHNREIDLRRQSLEDDLLAKEKEVEFARDSAEYEVEINGEKHQGTYEQLQESLDKQKEAIDRYYENIIEDERYWAKVREDILSGNVQKYQTLLETFQLDISNHMEFLGESIAQNFIDRLEKVQDTLSAITGSIKDTFKQVDNAISQQNGDVSEAESQNSVPEPTRSGDDVMGSLPEDPTYQPPASSTSGSGSTSGGTSTSTSAKGIVEVISDVWLHSAPDFNVSSRIRVLKKGERYKYYGEKNGMYNLGAYQWASKKYLKIVTSGTSGTTSTSTTQYKTTSDLNLRSSPAYGNNVIAVMPKGATVEYLGMESGWAKIRYNGKTGYAGKSYLQQFDTGGFTGDWSGNDGRLALLHKKELVLNKEDTENVLDTVKMIRSIVSAEGLKRVVSSITTHNKTAPASSNATYHLNVNVEKITGDKKGGEVVFNTIMKNLKKMGK